MSLIFTGAAALMLASSLGILFHARWVKRLPSLRDLAGTEPAVGSVEKRCRCSVVIAARDEQDRIEQTIRHALAQTGVEVEVIVVDDRSTDRTNEIVRRIAAEDSRVQIRRIDALPERWLGKCHACYVGAALAAGDWILFTDADCWLSPDVLARAVSLANREAADHVALTPGPAAETFSARAWHLAFLLSLANWIAGVNRDKPRAYFGLGAFNLVRASAYRECGGYEALRLTILDDVKLGLLLRRAGKRTRGFLGGDDVECHWGATIGTHIRVMEKNYFSAIDFRLELAIAAVTGGLLFFGIVILGLVSRTVPGLAAGLAPLWFSLPAACFARRLGWSWGIALLAPFFFPVLWFALLNSVVVTLRRGGIHWRETFYGLETLRRGTLR